MRAPEPLTPPTVLHGTRVVAPCSSLDRVTLPSGATMLRFAPDDAFVLGADSVPCELADLDDEHAIVLPESGYVGCWLSDEQLAHVAGHIEWPLPARRPLLAQGLIAGVPAKLYLGGSETGSPALLLTNATYAHELWERLS